jgi:hypothetical protein
MVLKPANRTVCVYEGLSEDGVWGVMMADNSVPPIVWQHRLPDMPRVGWCWRRGAGRLGLHLPLAAALCWEPDSRGVCAAPALPWHLLTRPGLHSTSWLVLPALCTGRLWIWRGGLVARASGEFC